MGVVRVILAIIVGCFILGGISNSFEEEGVDKASTMLFTTGLIFFEVWLIGG